MTETVVLATGAREPSGILHDGIAANAVLSLKEAGLSAHVDAAVLSADGALVLVGWVFDPERRVSGLAGLVKDPGPLKEGFAARHFAVDAGGLQWLPVERPDVTAAKGGTPGEDLHGFVLVVPVFSPEQVPALLLKDGRYVVLPCKLLREGREAEASLERCLASGGPQLHAACQAALGESHPLSRFVADSLVDDSQPLRQLAVCDQALLVDGQVLLLTGWIGARAREIASLSLVAATETFELHSRLTRYPRPDLDQAFPRTAGEALGFIAAVPVAVPPPGWVELQIVCHSGARERCRMGVMQRGDLGEPDYTPIDEEHGQRPINPYGASKLMVESILRDFHAAHGLNSISLRYFNACGADPEGELGECHDPETHLIPLVLQAASGRRDSITVFGRDYQTRDGTCVRDYIHIEDLCSAHGLALEALLRGEKEGALAFNLGNGKGYSVQEVIDTAQRVVAEDGFRLTVKDGQRRPGDPARLVADATRAKEELGWRPRYADLETIIRHAWAWEKRMAGIEAAAGAPRGGLAAASSKNRAPITHPGNGQA